VVAWEAVRAMAGAPIEAKQYYLERDILDPPRELTNQVFPLLERSLQLIEDSIQNGSRESEIAGKSLLSLFEYLRKVIIQDGALLLKMVF
jgi:hypothetical protein